MIEAILGIVAGLITALPAILRLVERRANTQGKVADANARQDSNLLDRVLESVRKRLP